MFYYSFTLWSCLLCKLLIVSCLCSIWRYYNIMGLPIQKLYGELKKL
nr:MAG TPA: Maf-like protein [Caudoviricetes sp.]